MSLKKAKRLLLVLSSLIFNIIKIKLDNTSLNVKIFTFKLKRKKERKMSYLYKSIKIERSFRFFVYLQYYMVYITFFKVRFIWDYLRKGINNQRDMSLNNWDYLREGINNKIYMSLKKAIMLSLVLWSLNVKIITLKLKIKKEMKNLYKSIKGYLLNIGVTRIIIIESKEKGIKILLKFINNKIYMSLKKAIMLSLVLWSLNVKIITLKLKIKKEMKMNYLYKRSFSFFSCFFMWYVNFFMVGYVVSVNCIAINILKNIIFFNKIYKILYKLREE